MCMVSSRICKNQTIAHRTRKDEPDGLKPEINFRKINKVTTSLFVFVLPACFDNGNERGCSFSHIAVSQLRRPKVELLINPGRFFCIVNGENKLVN